MTQAALAYQYALDNGADILSMSFSIPNLGNVRGLWRMISDSFSGPQGAGVAALILSAAPTLPAWRVKEILEQTARDLGPPGKDNDYGAGLIDAFAAVTTARARQP